MLKIAFISSKLLNNFFSFFLESILQKCTVKFEEVLKLLASFIEGWSQEKAWLKIVLFHLNYLIILFLFF